MYSIQLTLILLYLFHFSLSNNLDNNTGQNFRVSVQNFDPISDKVAYILDGSEAVLGEFPFIVSLQIGGKHRCGGSLVDMRTIVTAAHCLYNVSNPLDYEVVAGIVNLKDYSIERQSSQVVWALPHEAFHNGLWQSDIALLKTKNEFVETKYVKSIQLPPPGHEPSGFGRVVGWGATKQGRARTNNDHLMEAMLSIYTYGKCRYYYGEEIDGTVFCAGSLTNHEDTCKGDSGGPLICMDYLCGVIAAGFGCGKSDDAGIYTKISHFTEWILKFLEPEFIILANDNTIQFT